VHKLIKGEKMNDLIEQYIKELKGINENGEDKSSPFIHALIKKAEEHNWTPDNELMQFLFFVIDLNSAAFAYLEAQKKGTRHTDEMRQGFSLCVQTMAGIFSEIKNKGDDKWRNMGKK
jgi:hypothetical protein